MSDDQSSDVETLSTLTEIDNKTFEEEDDWNMIILKCKSLAAKWEQLSAFLGLPSSLIDQIRLNRPNDSSGCWNEALNQWIKQNYNTNRFGKPSWKTLLRAIAHVDRRLFGKLASEHKCHAPFVDSVLPYVSEGHSQVKVDDEILHPPLKGSSKKQGEMTQSYGTSKIMGIIHGLREVEVRTRVSGTHEVAQKTYKEGKVDPHEPKKMLKGSTIALCNDTDNSCEVPSTSNECKASEQLPSSESEEEERISFLSPKEIMDEVHALEHIYNGECFMKDPDGGCRKPPSAESLQQVSVLAKAHREGMLCAGATKLFKEYIFAHCGRCNDVNCKVPHMATGCPHPGMPQNIDPFLINYTDGLQVLAQATDYDSPNHKNIVPIVHFCLRSSMQPQKSDSPSNAKQLSNEATDEQVHQNGCFPSVDVLRKHSDEVKPLYFTLTQIQYSLQELKILSQLKHENAIFLSGVVYNSAYIYQLMPCMSGSFQREVEMFGTLLSLIRAQKSSKKPTIYIFKNVYYIYQGITAGVSYLHQNGMVHGDIKASNILISKPLTCRCKSTLLCTCQYKVFISDFDSVGHNNPSCHRFRNKIVVLPPTCRCESTLLCTCQYKLFISDFNNVGHNNTSRHLVRDKIVVLHPGTLFYRSPEAHFNTMGPWCDMWSIGCSIIHLILGCSSADKKKKACYGVGKRPTDIYLIKTLLVLLLETCDAREQLVYLQHNLCKECPEFNQLVKVAEDCLNIDCQRRIQAPKMHDRLSMLLKHSQ